MEERNLRTADGKNRGHAGRYGIADPDSFVAGAHGLSAKILKLDHRHHEQVYEETFAPFATAFCRA